MASTEVPAHGDNVLYTEHQRVPLTWWFFAAGVVFIIAWQAQMAVLSGSRWEQEFSRV